MDPEIKSLLTQVSTATLSLQLLKRGIRPQEAVKPTVYPEL